MNHNKSSGDLSVCSVIIPELSRICHYPENLAYTLSDAFSFANARGIRILLMGKELLNSVFPYEIHGATDPEEYTRILEALYSMIPDVSDTTLAFPGHIDPSHLLSHVWDEEHYQRIASLCSVLCLRIYDKSSAAFAEGIINHIQDPLADITVITDRSSLARIDPDTVSRTVERNIPVTFCNADVAQKNLRISGDRICQTSGFAVYGGKYVTPGSEILKCTDIVPDDIFPDSEYMAQELISDVLASESAKSFVMSKRGTLYHRTDKDHDVLLPWSVCFENCIGSEKDPYIRDIFSGGASHTVSFTAVTDDTHHSESDKYSRILDCLAVSCRHISNHYAVKAVPSLVDRHIVYSLEDIISAVRHHLVFSRNIYGGAVLEICFEEGTRDILIHRIHSVLSEFFGLGGQMIRFTEKGDRNG